MQKFIQSYKEGDNNNIQEDWLVPVLLTLGFRYSNPENQLFKSNSGNFKKIP